PARSPAPCSTTWPDSARRHSSTCSPSFSSFRCWSAHGSGCASAAGCDRGGVAAPAAARQLDCIVCHSVEQEPSMNETAAVADSGVLTATITYALRTDEKLVNETLGRNIIRRRTSGSYERRLVPIRDGRMAGERLSLDQQGFVLVDHPTRMQ